ncbi:MAG TPA: alpha/beta fold hydrolase [Acidobacteriota bacterium]|nr:alpha/beta fold hydrolase [Acidobacteriota bacterium]
MASALEKMEQVLENRKFHPHPAISGPHLQTLVSARLKRDFSWGWRASADKLVELGDGSLLRVVVIAHSRTSPTLVAVHGMSGSSDSGYMQGFSHKAHREGWNAVLLNLYNLNEKLTAPRIFHAGASRETAEALQLLSRMLSLEEIYLVGVSMGGNIVLKLLGEFGESLRPLIRAGAVVSPMVDLDASWPYLEKPSNRIYRWYFVERLKKLVEQNAVIFRDFLEMEKLRRVESIREFDELVTAPLSGFEDAHHYYREVSSTRWFSKIRVPTLVLHSKDDPLLPWKPLTSPQLQRNPWILTHLTERGGHVGFLERDRFNDIDRKWAENRVIDFFRLTEARSRGG